MENLENHTKSFCKILILMDFYNRYTLLSLAEHEKYLGVKHLEGDIWAPDMKWAVSQVPQNKLASQQELTRYRNYIAPKIVAKKHTVVLVYLYHPKNIFSDNLISVKTGVCNFSKLIFNNDFFFCRWVMQIFFDIVMPTKRKNFTDAVRIEKPLNLYVCCCMPIAGLPIFSGFIKHKRFVFLSKIFAFRKKTEFDVQICCVVDRSCCVALTNTTGLHLCIC